MFPNNLLQLLNRFWGKELLTSLNAYTRRHVLNDEKLSIFFYRVSNSALCHSLFPNPVFNPSLFSPYNQPTCLDLDHKA